MINDVLRLQYRYINDRIVTRVCYISLVEAQYPCACSASLSPDRAILVRALAGDIMLCSREGYLVYFFSECICVYFLTDQYRLICGTCELVDGWEIAKSSPAKVFLNEEVFNSLDIR